MAISSVSAGGFLKFFYGQMKNCPDKTKMTGWNSLEITCKNEPAILTGWIRLKGSFWA